MEHDDRGDGQSAQTVEPAEVDPPTIAVGPGVRPADRTGVPDRLATHACRVPAWHLGFPGVGMDVMVGRRQRDLQSLPGGDDEIVLIELLGDSGHDEGGDLRFGMGRADRSDERAPNRVAMIALGIAAAAAIGGAVMLFSRDDRPAPATATTGVPPTTADGFVPVVVPSGSDVPADGPFDGDSTTVDVTTDPPGTTGAPGTTVFDTGAGQVLAAEVLATEASATGPALGLYLAAGDPSTRIRRLDLATGIVSALPEVSGRAWTVAAIGTGTLIVDSSVIGDVWAMAPGPTGSVWATSEEIDQIDLATGNRLRTIAPPPGSLFGWVLVGSVGDGRPVVLGPDAHAYVVNPDDSYERLGDGFVLGVQPGGYWEVICDAAAICQTVLHGNGGPVAVAIPAVGVGENLSVSIAPSGRHALVVVNGLPSLVDFVTGTRSDLKIGGTVRGQITGAFNSTSPGVWVAPDDRYLFFPADNNVALYDTATGEIRSLPMPGGLFNVILLGLAP